MASSLCRCPRRPESPDCVSVCVAGLHCRSEALEHTGCMSGMWQMNYGSMSGMRQIKTGCTLPTEWRVLLNGSGVHGDRARKGGGRRWDRLRVDALLGNGRLYSKRLTGTASPLLVGAGLDTVIVQIDGGG